MMLYALLGTSFKSNLFSASLSRLSHSVAFSDSLSAQRLVAYAVERDLHHTWAVDPEAASRHLVHALSHGTSEPKTGGTSRQYLLRCTQAVTTTAECAFDLPM